MAKKDGIIRVITTKIGLDTHTTGILLVSQVLRNAGMEVTYLGKYQTPEAIVQSALQEDADVIGISCLSSHYRGIINVMDLIKQKNIDNILVIVGGTIPQQQIRELKNAGVSEVFTPGTKLESIADYITSKLGKSETNVT